MKLEIRHAIDLDIKEINNIYNFYVKETPYTVGCKGKEIIGFASSVTFREKEAYQNSIESSVYIKKEYVGKGYGKLLMLELIDILKESKVRRIYALITYPNKSSVVLHKSLGFKMVGKLNDVGLKFDKYWNVEIYELKI